MKYTAIIPCAGNGSRVNATVAKQYVLIGNKTILQHTLEQFIQSELIERIILVVNPDDTQAQNYLVLSNKIKLLYCGGETRAQTVYNALINESFSNDERVLVHDAARCCITTQMIEKMINKLKGHGVGGILAIQAKDTVLQMQNQEVQFSLPRKEIYLAQTPQMFRYPILLDALSSLADLSQITDESSAIIASGYVLDIIEGSQSNLKITYPEDIELASYYLGKQGRL